MKIDIYPDASPLPGEDEILERLGKLNRPDDRKAVSILGVANAQHGPRLRIVAYTEAEEEIVIGLLERRSFKEVLAQQPAVQEEATGGTSQVIHGKHPDFDYLFVPRK